MLLTEIEYNVIFIFSTELRICSNVQINILG